MTDFLRNPQRSRFRRALFQLHLWAGIAFGLYVLTISATGAALIFRLDFQKAAYPELFNPANPGIVVDIATVLERLKPNPQEHIVGVDAPTDARPVYLAYVASENAFRTVLIDPSDARVLGELSDRSLIRSLQDLHFNLLMGKTGDLINGVGAICLLFLCLTGPIVWWQGSDRWRLGLLARWSGSWPKFNWELHSAIGVWSVILIAMWAITALSFTFPKQFRGFVRSTFTVTTHQPPKSTLLRTAGVSPPAARELIDRARKQMPGQYVARFVLPASKEGAVEVLFANRQPTPANTHDFASVYLDQYTAETLQVTISPRRAVGDRILEWIGSIHVGNFGGRAIQTIWFCFGLAPAALFVTGAISWWRRVVRPAIGRGRLNAFRKDRTPDRVR